MGLFVRQLAYLDSASFTLHVQPGACLCVSGSSGSGKSLLLRAIADLDPHRGEIYLDGELCHNMPAPQWRRQVALLSAETHWWDDRVGAHFAAQDILPAVWMDALGFDQHVMNWQVHRLSSGERQRLGLLRLLALRPQVLLLDEPTANLDADNALRVENLLQEYRREFNAGLLWVSHDNRQIRRVADTCLYLPAGEIRGL